ncbi:MAG: hypothetical protein OXI88_23225 [Gammaproteobacteria bacterium]|nr:hypothetical protein [Gammaproteobacteria bacterium]MDE0286362.1 hypothetical protein [Gammaproteobacteria bacterium]MDE0514681.1 hypothetical protein [Gammaproteobacteria bacterium]
MNEDLAQAWADLQAARERKAAAQREVTRCSLIYQHLQAQHVRRLYGDKPFKERLPRLAPGRAKTDEERQRRRVHHRMIYLELLARKADTGRPIIDHCGPSLARDLADELHLSEATIRKSWRIGAKLDGVAVF